MSAHLHLLCGLQLERGFRFRLQVPLGLCHCDLWARRFQILRNRVPEIMR